ncbi:hypothetical protein PybrP1_012759 [[Pythium] brassicae (nom. inval.)]|nr:hypothetical protein PybrP1_012759 [[Pythium] brassicae (nom. inval.)]
MDNFGRRTPRALPEPDAEAVPLPPVLYRLRGANCQDVWTLARLVPDPKYTGLPCEILVSAHAKEAFCLVCRRTLPYQIGQTAAVRSYMENYHLDRLREVAQESAREAPSSSGDSNSRTASRMKKKVKAPDQEQKRANHLLASWVAKSSRPLALVEDEGFREFVSFVAGIEGVEFKIPKRAQIRSEVARIAAELRKNLKLRIRGDADFYAMTTDTWTDRAQRGFMALTLHHIDTNFVSRNWALEVDHLPGMHTASSMAE